MKINEVEAAVGVTKKNIRFYEEEGLITPGREPGNGYRSYSQADVERLRRIKLLRKLGVPLEDIRQMLSGAHTVGDGMRRHLVTLERERQNLDAAARADPGRLPGTTAKAAPAGGRAQFQLSIPVVSWYYHTIPNEGFAPLPKFF